MELIFKKEGKKYGLELTFKCRGYEDHELVCQAEKVGRINGKITNEKVMSYLNRFFIERCSGGGVGRGLVQAGSRNSVLRRIKYHIFDCFILRLKQINHRHEAGLVGMQSESILNKFPHIKDRFSLKMRNVIIEDILLT